MVVVVVLLVWVDLRVSPGVDGVDVLLDSDGVTASLSILLAA